MIVTYHSVAALVTPAPMKATPQNAEQQSHKIVRHEGGWRATSCRQEKVDLDHRKGGGETNQQCRPQPIALPCSVRLLPIGSPAMTARTSRTAISCRPIWAGIPIIPTLDYFR
jgi:hypothetical protein